MKDKKLHLISIIMGMIMLLTGCGNLNASKTTNNSDNSKEKVVTVRFGADASNFSMSFQIAKAKEIFKKYNIDAQISTFSSGIDTINAALTGQVDVGIASDFSALSRLSTGKLRILSFLQSTKAGNVKFVARDGINNIQDIKGHAIGVSKGTISEYETSIYLQKYNIKESDVKIEKFSSSVEILAAFEKGDIQGGLFNGLVLQKVLDFQGAQVIGTLDEIPFAGKGFLLVTEDLVDKQPEASKRILQALNEAEEWIKENQEDAAEIDANVLKLSKDSVLTVLKDQQNEIRLNDEDVQQLEDVYKYGVDNNMFPGGYEVKDYILTDPLKEALPDKLTYDPNHIK